jgi:MFS family permease
MTPNAALVATVLYGWWSNFSYRNALIFAACCSVLGNISYALALRYDSLNMVLIGRFLNGFGSARAINRRYIADTFSKADRTAASADFVTSGALGMAFGPAIAFMLGQVDFPENNPLWSVVNAPGFVMMTLWSVYLILVILFFEEPDRSHMFKESDDMASTENAAGIEDDVGHSETEPLVLKAEIKHIGSGDSDLTCDKEGEEKEQKQPLWKNVPVMMTLWMVSFKKCLLFR